jgi:DNA repair photolyase
VLQVRESEARSILTPTCGFIAAAGFTHSLTPARNCTFGCTYCYVPTMRVQGGLKPEDWQRWGQFTTFKSNAAELLSHALRASQIIYCSPLVDPYQPAEAQSPHMPAILEQIIEQPPAVFVIQTRGPLILRDLDLLQRLRTRTRLRVSFSVTTEDDRVRRLYEPLCASIDERFAAIGALRRAGIETWITLAPLLPCDPDRLVARALAASDRDIICDPFHTRAAKRCGATTRDAGLKVSTHHHYGEWHDPQFQSAMSERMRKLVEAAGRHFGVGPAAFAWLASSTDKESPCLQAKSSRG